MEPKQKNFRFAKDTAKKTQGARRYGVTIAIMGRANRARDEADSSRRARGECYWMAQSYNCFPPSTGFGVREGGNTMGLQLFLIHRNNSGC